MKQRLKSSWYFLPAFLLFFLLFLGAHLQNANAVSYPYTATSTDAFVTTSTDMSYTITSNTAFTISNGGVKTWALTKFPISSLSSLLSSSSCIANLYSCVQNDGYQILYVPPYADSWAWSGSYSFPSAGYSDWQAVGAAAISNGATANVWYLGTEANNTQNNYIFQYEIDGSNNVIFQTWQATPPPLSISFDTPTSSATQADFSQWITELSNLATTTPYREDIVYSLSGSGVWYDDFSNLEAATYANPFINSIYKNNPLTSAFSSTTAWDATAYLFATSSYADNFGINNSSSAVASTTISFNVSSNIPSGETSSTIPITVNCQYTSSSFFADPIGNIQNGICNALTFLFVPNTSEQADLTSRFNTLKSTYGSKPPFGYISAVVTPFQSFSVHSSSSWPSLVSTTTESEFSDVFSPLDIGLSVIVYVLLGAWVFHKARNIEL